MKKLKFIDLFAGMGGFRLGFENACRKNNIIPECILTAEIKKQALLVYKENFGEEGICNDVTSINEKDIEDFDGLLAGFPCQPFSTAGNGFGFEDTRGTLFFDVARILKEKKPSFFILENVKNLLIHDNGRTLEVILNTLKEIGYKVSYKILNAKDFDIPQLRERIFIVGTINKEISLDFEPQNNRVIKDILCPNLYEEVNEDSFFNQQIKLNYKNIFNLHGKILLDKRNSPNYIHSWDLGLLGDINEEEKKLLNLISFQRRKKKWQKEKDITHNEGVPLTLEDILTFYTHPNLKKMLQHLVELKYLYFVHPDYMKTQNGKKVKLFHTHVEKGYSISMSRISYEFNRFLDPNDYSRTLTATDAKKVGVIEQNGVRKLVKEELCGLFGYPKDWKVNVSNNHMFDLFGNSLPVPIVEAISNRIIKEIYKN
jgi:DNA (cytosine-5)-methyltransferase 1